MIARASMARATAMAMTTVTAQLLRRAQSSLLRSLCLDDSGLGLPSATETCQVLLKLV